MHYFDLKYSSPQTHKVFKNCYGKSALYERTIHYWISKFKSETSLYKTIAGQANPQNSRKKFIDLLKLVIV